MKTKHRRINILQAYYEVTLANNTNGSTSLTEGIAYGLKLALQHFGYNPDQLDNMEYVYNELMDLKQRVITKLKQWSKE